MDQALKSAAPPTETPLFFAGGGYRLFGVFHQAQVETHVPYVFCHPFAEDKLWAHRVFVTFARELARRGHHVLRFDYMGNGDSEGDFKESSVETALQDLARAIDLVRTRTGAEAVGLLGLRFGSTLAAIMAERRDDIAELVLWAPIVAGDQYMQELLRTNIATQMAVYREVRLDRVALSEALTAGQTVNVDGYEICSTMYTDVSKLNLLSSPCRFDGPVFIAQIERASSGRKVLELDQLRLHYADATLALVQDRPFWKEIDLFYDSAPNLFAATLGWMDHRQETMKPTQC